MRMMLMCAAAGVVASGMAYGGAIQPLTNAAPEGAELTFLLTDGRVLAQSFTDQGFYTLTPDNTGSYVNGTWARVADLPRDYAPYAGASAVLADGRVLLIGGEYNFGEFVLTNLGAIYDPVTDEWARLKAPDGAHWNFIGDSPAVVLPDGRFLIGDKLHKDMAAYDPKTGKWAILAYTGKADFNAEEGWTLLPDGTVFTVDVKDHPNAEIYDPSPQLWTSAGTTGVDLVSPGSGKIEYGHHKYYRPPGEIGAAMLLPDGSVFVAGAIPFPKKIAHTAIYKNGKWTAGPDFPKNENPADTGSVLLPSGNVLQSTLSGNLYEFDGQSLIQQNANVGGNCMLLLPTGQVLIGGTGIYDPAGSPQPGWAPTIASYPSSVTRGSTYRISGTQFNGLSQANALGDELETFTNCPMVRITNNDTGHVFYARTHDHSTMGVATGNAAVATRFDVSSSTETGASSLVVVANGIASAPVSISVD
jgi:hypothetical protein